MVNPSESISLSIAFGVASNVDTTKITNKHQNNLERNSTYYIKGTYFQHHQDDLHCQQTYHEVFDSI